MSFFKKLVPELRGQLFVNMKQSKAEKELIVISFQAVDLQETKKSISHHDCCLISA